MVDSQQSNDSQPSFFGRVFSGGLSSAGTSTLMMGIVAGVMALGHLAWPAIPALTMGFAASAAVVVTAAFIFGSILAVKEAREEASRAPIFAMDERGRGVMLSPEISAATRSAMPYVIPVAMEQAPDLAVPEAAMPPASTAWQDRMASASRAPQSASHTEAILAERSAARESALAL